MSINISLKKKVIIALSAVLVVVASLYGYNRYADNQLTKEQEEISEHWGNKLSKSDFQKIQHAAQKGNAAGLCNLGRCYYFGEHVPKNLQKAFEYYKQSAEKKYALGLRVLGYLYFNGEGAIIDYPAAINCWNEAIKRGDIMSYEFLANAYYNGRGAKKDIKKAAELYESAAKQTVDPKSKAKLLAKLASIYSTDSIVMDQNKAFNYIYSAATLDKGYESSLATFYIEGIGTNVDAQQAISIYKKWVNKGSDYAMFKLALCYATGNGVNYDLQKAEYYYRLAALKGNATAQCNLGVLYERKGNYQEAVKWYIKSAQQEEAAAQYNLGLAFLYGKGVDQDRNTAIDWLRKAKDAGNPDAKNAYEKLTK